MSSMGKAIRLERLINRKTKKTIIVPMDHGLTMGTIKGLENMPKIVNQVAEGGANAVLLHAGVALAGHRTSMGVQSTKDIGLIIHLSASTKLSPTPNRKVIVCPVEDAVRMGADGVSIHINIGDNDEPEMLQEMGEISSMCRYFGMPLLAMMYPRGPNIKVEHDPEVVNIAARVGAELGADIVKTNYTGNVDTFKPIVKGTPAPVIIAGGPKMNTVRDILTMVHEAVNEAGAMGIAMGRNVWQSDDPTKMVQALSKIINENWTVEETLKEFHF
ncbi:MAG: 2-amino-3,7-dideoxy-D-threo-hept-6-ulosonate synthase [Candidatus Sigynarchaeum springense]